MELIGSRKHFRFNACLDVDKAIGLVELEHIINPNNDVLRKFVSSYIFKECIDMVAEF